MPRKLLCILVFLVFIAGCAAAGVRVTEDKLTTLKKGETTIDEVITMFGKPTNSTLDSNGTRIIVYSYAKVSTRAETFIPIVGLFAGGTDIQSNSVAMTFNGKGILINYSSSASELGVGTGMISSNTTFDRVEDQPREQNTVNLPKSQHSPGIKPATTNLAIDGIKPPETKNLEAENKKEITPSSLITPTPTASQSPKGEAPKFIMGNIDDSLNKTASEFNNRLVDNKGQLQSLYLENSSTLIAAWSSEKCYYLRPEILDFVFSLFNNYPGLETVESINIIRTCDSDVKEFTLNGTELRQFRDKKDDYTQLLQGIE